MSPTASVIINATLLACYGLISYWVWRSRAVMPDHMPNRVTQLANRVERLELAVRNQLDLNRSLMNAVQAIRDAHAVQRQVAERMLQETVGLTFQPTPIPHFKVIEKTAPPAPEAEPPPQTDFERLTKDDG